VSRYAHRPPRRTSGADSNTDDLLTYAEALGMSVAIIEDRNGCPEFLCGGWGVMRLAEGKRQPVPGLVKPSEAKLRTRQEKWRAWWRGPPPLLWRTRADVEATALSMRMEAESDG